MSAALQLDPGIGHNSVPMGAMQVRLYLIDSEAPLVKRRDDLLAGVAHFEEKHPTITNEEDQARAADFVRQIQQHIKLATDHFTPAKKPFLDGGREVDKFFKEIKEPLEAGLNRVRAPMTAYANEQERIRRAEAARIAAEAQAEAARIARELADQQRAERERQEAIARAEYVPPAPIEAAPVSIDDAIAAAEIAEKATKAAVAKPADFSRTRGEMGAVSSLREIVEVELVNLDEVPREFLIFDAAKAKKAAQAGRKHIPGVLITRSNGIAVR